MKEQENGVRTNTLGEQSESEASQDISVRLPKSTHFLGEQEARQYNT
jgi:hypothetical protein